MTWHFRVSDLSVIYGKSCGNCRVYTGPKKRTNRCPLKSSTVNRTSSNSTGSTSVCGDTRKATIIQTRHRIPEEKMTASQILVLQVPKPDPLRLVEFSQARSRLMHAERDYHRLWVHLYEEIRKRGGKAPPGIRRPVLVNKRYIMDPSPIPAWDILKLSQSETLFLFGAGRDSGPDYSLAHRSRGYSQGHRGGI